MKAIARTLLLALTGVWGLATTLPAQADHGRGWEYRDHHEYRDFRDHGRGPHWRAHKHHHPVYAPPVVIYRPPVVVYESPVVYERRVYHGPT